MDSVAEPVMVVNVVANDNIAVYYQVQIPGNNNSDTTNQDFHEHIK